MVREIMVELVIDGRPVSVAEGTTVLDAARRLGIFIPTLCHVPGFSPSASCFLCAVQIDGRANLSPSCAMPAAQGMIVRTDSDEVRASRKTVLELLLSDHVGDCAGPCATGCPARLDIPGFLSLLTRNEFPRSAQVVRDALIFPASLGRICPRLCEQRCRHGDADEPLSISALHRFSADRDLASAAPYAPRREQATGKRVAIVGAGPAGLAAAYELLRRGHGVALFDAHQEPGGMLRWGIPAFRLPGAVLAREIESIRALGGEFRMGQLLGRDITLQELRRDFDAVFLAIGAQRSRPLGCDGEELAMPAVEFLAETASGRHPQIGERVLVIGGGNTAMDTARCAVRLGAAVTVLYRRTRREMPCLMAEVEAAEEEGVALETLAAPLRLERAGGQLRLICCRMALGEPDASGRARPLPVAGSEFSLKATCVIAAIGQEVNTRALEASGLGFSASGIVVDPKTLATSLDGVFAGGDAVTGPDLAVRAVAGGKLAAASMDQYLHARAVRGHPELISVLMGKLDEEELAQLFRGIESARRAPMPQLPVADRVGNFEEVELGLRAEDVAGEAGRCIQCGCRKASTCRLREYATEYGADPLRFPGARRRFQRDSSHAQVVYEPGKCILCGACVVAAAQAGEPLGLAIVGRGFDAAVAAPMHATLAQGLEKAAARAAEVCPTGAIALKGTAQPVCETGQRYGCYEA